MVERKGKTIEDEFNSFAQQHEQIENLKLENTALKKRVKSAGKIKKWIIYSFAGITLASASIAGYFIYKNQGNIFQNNDYKSKYDEVKTDFKKIVNSYESEVSKLKLEKTDLEGKLKESEEIAANSIDGRKGLYTKIESLKADNEEYKAEIQIKNGTIDSLITEKSKLASKLNFSKEEIDNLEKKYNELNASYKKNISKVNVLEEKIAKLEILPYDKPWGRIKSSDSQYFVYDKKGGLIFSGDLKYTINNPYIIFSDWVRYDIVKMKKGDVDGDGKNELVVLANSDQNSVVAIFEHDSKLKGAIWNPGNLYDLLTYDITGDKTEEIIVCGDNYKIRSEEKVHPFMFSLNAKLINGEHKFSEKGFPSKTIWTVTGAGDHSMKKLKIRNSRIYAYTKDNSHYGVKFDGESLY